MQRAAEERWKNETPPRCILWVDKVDRNGRVIFQTTNIALGIQSRLDGMKGVANKTDLEKCLTVCRDIGLQQYSLEEGSPFLRTWVLPEQKVDFEEHVKDQRLAAIARGRPSPTYIMKPSGGSEGNGIFLLQHERLVPRYNVATIPLVAQGYVPPLLHEGKKFDLRLYVLIRSVDPLEVYLHREGLARFCTQDYEQPTSENLEHAFTHLTNYSLNKNSDSFIRAASGDGKFAYAGCSKRPMTEVLRDLEERGLVEQEVLWNKIKDLVALTAIAMQPELALHYRSRFPRTWPSVTPAEAAAASEPRPVDRSQNAFHIIGVDVLIDASGCPRLLEVNSKPSQGIDVDGERSPVDVQVKEAVYSDALAFVSGSARSPSLCAVLGKEANHLRPTVNLLDRIRRIFEVLSRGNGAAKPKQGPAGNHHESSNGSQVSAEITNSKFATFARASGIHDMVPGSSVQLAFTKFCRRQEDLALSNRCFQFQYVPAFVQQRKRPSSDFFTGEQAKMRFPAFARALCEIADTAFSSLSGPHLPGLSFRAARLELLLEHIACSGQLSKQRPRPQSTRGHRSVTLATVNDWIAQAERERRPESAPHSVPNVDEVAPLPMPPPPPSLPQPPPLVLNQLLPCSSAAIEVPKKRPMRPRLRLPGDDRMRKALAWDYSKAQGLGVVRPSPRLHRRVSASHVLTQPAWVHTLPLSADAYGIPAVRR